MKIVLLLFLLLTGCDSSDELDHYFAEMKLLKAESIASLPLAPVLALFSYPESVKRRNPFKPMIQNTALITADSLRLVGTWKNRDLIWGLLKQVNGEVIKVKTGDLLPEYNGKIIKIEPDNLQIEQTLPGQQHKVIQLSLSG